MTVEEKLTKIIDIAVKNGYEQLIFRPKEHTISLLVGDMYAVYGILMSKNFAKAIWGDEPYCSACGRHHDSFGDCDAGFGYDDLTKWQYHLQQAVISDDPLEYYWENKPQLSAQMKGKE